MMKPTLTIEQLHPYLINIKTAKTLTKQINLIFSHYISTDAWKQFCEHILTPHLPFEIHLLLFSLCYPERETSPEKAIAWFTQKNNTLHLSDLMQETNYQTMQALHAWSIKNPILFWEKLIQKMKIVFINPPKYIANLNNPEYPNWLIDAKFNIVDSCFTAPPTHTAIVYQNTNKQIKKISYAELKKQVNQIASSLLQNHFIPGDAIAVILPMHPLAIAIYLAIIQIGCVVVSIADSFSSEEISTRLKIANTKAIFTQRYLIREQKTLPLYKKIIETNPPQIILLDQEKSTKNISRRPQDMTWETFLNDQTTSSSYPASAKTHCNILFSSGTTGTPKAIPWTHTTPIKAASDAFLYHNLNEKDVIAWPTNLGWMMGPWLVFAGFMNHATIALYEDSAKETAFGEFIQNAKVTVLGVVPTLVAHWRQTDCLKNCNWEKIRLFSSTGECSNPDDMLFLMSRANYAPIIEYCGGTEIGGAYLTSTLLENNCPSVFNTPTLGLDFILLNENNLPTDASGEVALIPPSIGLSTECLNANHHAIYFSDMPIYQGHLLRRHGDYLQRLSNHTYQVLGRLDDTMNLGGIKVSSAEIERVLVIPEIKECAAVAITEKKGPDQLVIFCALQKKQKNISITQLKNILQKIINLHLNPLFKIHDIVIVDDLPRTTSGKIMRRVLRMAYQNKSH